MKTIFGAAILAGALVACGDRVRPGSPTVNSEANPAPNATLQVSPTPNTTLKGKETVAPPVPPIFRVRWVYLSDKKTLHLQEDGTPGLLKEARLLAPDGHVVASGTSHLAEPGEPRQCGSPDYVPPLVASLDVGADISAALRARSLAYTLEVRDSSRWYSVELLDWSRIPGWYCLE